MTDERGEPDRLEAARRAKKTHRELLLAHPDIHGFGVGRRRRNGVAIDEFAVVVHLTHKLPREDVPESRLVPTRLTLERPDGSEVVVPVDVQEKPPPSPEQKGAGLTLTDRFR